MSGQDLPGAWFFDGAGRSRTEQDGAGRSRTDHYTTCPATVKQQDGAGRSRTEQDGAGRSRTEQDGAGRSRTEQDGAGRSRTEQLTGGYGGLCHRSSFAFVRLPKRPLYHMPGNRQARESAAPCGRARRRAHPPCRPPRRRGSAVAGRAGRAARCRPCSGRPPPRHDRELLPAITMRVLARRKCHKTGSLPWVRSRSVAQAAASNRSETVRRARA